MANRPPSSGQPGSKGPRSIESVSKTGPVAASSAVDAAQGVAGVDATARVDAVTAAPAVAAATAVAAAQKVAGSDRVQAVIDKLRRGTMTPTQAVQELIDDVVQRSLPGASPDSPLVKQLRALLQSYAQDDPYLASRIERLDPPSSPGSGQ
ncbi:MAG: hypothetical protein JNJ46_27035 [Myxococcales bacterium]|nr:hypothetical protein [Myxococcales bacterium]